MVARGGSIPPSSAKPKPTYKMKIKFNHDEKETSKAFGITDHEHTSAAIANTLCKFVADKNNKTLSQLGEFLQENLSENEILLLATQQVYETISDNEEFLFKAFIEHLKRSN